MPDFAAAPIQPIVEGLVTFPAGPGGAVKFDGKGVSAIIRDGATGGQGGYILVLDQGLPGNAGAVPFGPSPFPNAPDPDVRSMVTPIGFGLPPTTGIVFIGVSYIPGAPPFNARTVEVVMQTGLGVFADPINGFMIVVWRGIGGGLVL